MTADHAHEYGPDGHCVVCYERADASADWEVVAPGPVLIEGPGGSIVDLVSDAVLIRQTRSVR